MANAGLQRRLRRALFAVVAGGTLAIGIPASLAGPMPLTGTTLFEGGVDHGSIFGGLPVGWNGATPNSGPTVVAQGLDSAGVTLTSESAYALQFDVDGGDYDGYGDRSEVQGSTGEREGHVRAYRWSLYVPTSFPQYPQVATWQVLGQWHSQLDGSPPFAFYVNNWDAQRAQNIGLDFNLANTKSCRGSRKITQYGRRVWEMPLPRGRWVEFKLNVVWSAKDTTARHALWVDGVRQAFVGGGYELKLRNLDAGCFNYHKQGYYRGHTIGTPATVRFDNFRMTNEVFPPAPVAGKIAASTETPTAGSSLTLRDTTTGLVLRREWDLDGDGDFDDGEPGPDGTGREQILTPQRSGPRYVRLRVTDAFGAQSENYRRVAVRSSTTQPGRPLEVSITDSAGGVAAAGEMVTFIATPVDPDAVVNGYEWDLDGDGFDDGEQFSAHAIYTVPGPVTARVRATDHRGARAVASRSITVR